MNEFNELDILAKAATEAACKQFMDLDGQAGRPAPFGMKEEIYIVIRAAMGKAVEDGI